MKEPLSRVTIALLSSLALGGCGSGGTGEPPWTAPTVVATAGNTENFVTWTPGSTTGCFNVYWSTAPGVTPANGNRAPGRCGDFHHTGLTNGTAYHYLIAELRDGVEAWISPEVSATPSGPVGLAAAPLDGQIALTWTPLAGATSYFLYWSSTPLQLLSNMNRVAGATQPYRLAGLANGSPYYFRLSAVVGGAESPASPELTATPSP